MTKPPPMPDFDVPLTTPPNGKLTTIWWEWLQRYVRWGEECCEAGGDGGDGGGEGGAVSSVSGAPPVVVSGSALRAAGPEIEAYAAGDVTVSMPAATGSVNGYLKAIDWTTFNNKAPLASPVFTGTPTAPTPTAGDNDLSIATTAFVTTAVAASGALGEAPADGSNYARRGSDATWQAINSIGGISTAEYTYSTTTTTPPSTGQLRGNTTTQTAITSFYLHETNAVGVDITNALKIIAAGVKILVQDKTNSANVQYYTVTGPAVDNGVYFTIPVAWTSTGSATPFTPGRVIFCGFGIGSNNMPEAPTNGQIYGRRGSDTSWQAVVAADGDLTAIAALATTGIVRRTATDTWTAGTAVTNAELATMGAYAFKANNTSGSAVPADVTIAGLTTKASPTASDWIVLSDTAASGAFKKAAYPSGAVSPATVAPLMDGTAAVGTTTKYAREDHVHPSDTARVAKAGDTMSGDLTVPNITATGTLTFLNATGSAASSRITLGATGEIMVGRASYTFSNTNGLTYQTANGMLVECGTTAPLTLNKIGANGAVVLFYQDTTPVGSITVTGTTSTAYNTSSDGRLKKDLQNFDAGPMLDATNVYDFKWKDREGTRGYGVIAQEAVKVFPNAINHDESLDMWCVDYSKYVPLLLQEIKALRARVAAIEAVG